MNSINIDILLKVLAGIFVLVAIICAIILIKLYKQEKTTRIEKRIKIHERILAVVSILATLMAFFAPAWNEYKFNSIIENNYGNLFYGPVQQVNIYAPIGGGAANQVVVPDIPVYYDEVESWTVGWADSICGRRDYTLQEVNEGVLNHKIVFNSISDSVIGHEFNFVGARENNGVNNGFNGNEIEAEKGKTYVVRIYAHNNSPLGEEDTAYNVSERFEISEPKHVIGNDVALEGFDSSNGYYSVAVHGYIMVPNQEITWYSDGVKFVSNRPFHLEYVKGTALFENNEIGNAEHQGYRLSDDIIGDGVLIGYDAMDGRVPACYQYSSYTSIVVMPVFE